MSIHIPILQLTENMEVSRPETTECISLFRLNSLPFSDNRFVTSPFCVYLDQNKVDDHSFYSLFRLLLHPAYYRHQHKIPIIGYDSSLQNAKDLMFGVVNRLGEMVGNKSIQLFPVQQPKDKNGYIHLFGQLFSPEKLPGESLSAEILKNISLNDWTFVLTFPESTFSIQMLTDTWKAWCENSGKTYVPLIRILEQNRLLSLENIALTEEKEIISQYYQVIKTEEIKNFTWYKNEFEKTLTYYHQKYERLPLWYKKMGAVIRKLSHEKK